MYNCDYEYDIMAVLRILKFLAVYKPEAAKHMAARYNRFDLDDVLLFLYEELNNAVDDVYNEYDEENDAELLLLWDESFEEFISMTAALSPQPRYSRCAAEKKFEDIVMFFFSDRNSGIYDLEFVRQAGRLYLKLVLMNDYCEPDGVAFAVTDLLIYIRKENERLNGMLRQCNVRCLPQTNTEEAA